MTDIVFLCTGNTGGGGCRDPSPYPIPCRLNNPVGGGMQLVIVKISVMADAFSKRREHLIKVQNLVLGQRNKMDKDKFKTLERNI